MKKKILTISASIVIDNDDEDYPIESFDDCLSDYDNIDRPLERLKDCGWNVKFVSLEDYENKDIEELKYAIEYFKIKLKELTTHKKYINHTMKGIYERMCEFKCCKNSEKAVKYFGLMYYNLIQKNKSIRKEMKMYERALNEKIKELKERK